MERKLKWNPIHSREEYDGLPGSSAQILSVDAERLGADPMGDVRLGGSITHGRNLGQYIGS